jgi:hypothetical protein
VERLETRLDGPILIAPSVLGDERRILRRDLSPRGLHQARHAGRDGAGQPVPLGAGMHFHVGEGAAKLVRAGRGQSTT